MESSGILPRQTIKELCDSGGLITDIEEASLQAASYDLRVGTMFRNGRILRAQDRDDEDFLVEPGEVVTFLTMEEVKLPADIAGFVSPINRQSEKGLLVLNPGHIDPGYEGAISVKVINLRKTTMRIAPGTIIFTIVFERLPFPTDSPYRGGKSRAKREDDLCEAVLETGIPSLTELLTDPNNSPFALKREVDQTLRDAGFVRADQVDERVKRALDEAPFVRMDQVAEVIKSHAMSRVLTLSAVLGSVIAVIGCAWAFASLQAGYMQTLAAIRSLTTPAQQQVTDTRGSNEAASTPKGGSSNSTAGQSKDSKKPGGH